MTSSPPVIKQTNDHSSSDVQEYREPPIAKESIVHSNDLEGPTAKKARKTEHGRVVADHYNSIEEQGLAARNKSRIVYMRNFNNWIKSFLLNKYLNLIKDNSPDDYKIAALDIGCGKGGDLLKWQKGNIRHLICADIAETSLEQCSERYSSMKSRGRIFSAEFIAADCTKVLLKQHFQNSQLLADLVSCQFSFHYCFESLGQAEIMIRNVSENLKKGGYFVASIPDSNKIVHKIRSSKSNCYSNEVFKISFAEDRSEDPPLFGDKYHFYLDGSVDCPEFLVHVPTLVRICKKYNLEMIYKKPFEEIYKEGMADRDTSGLLFRMKALELYNPSSNYFQPASDSPEEYRHAHEYIRQQNLREVKTLSRSEWEAACLYMAVAFRKTS